MKYAWLLALCLFGCSDPRTEVVVVVSSFDLVIPHDLDQVHLTVTDPSAPTGEQLRFDSQDVPLCAPDQTGNCFSLPLVVTLVPGSQRPQDAVRVQVDAKLGTQVITSDASVFTFITGQSERLDFVLHPRCIGTDCAASDQSCDLTGTCGALAPTPFQGEPQLDGGPPGLDGLVPVDDLGGDLAGSDGGAPPDLLPPPGCPAGGTGGNNVGDPCSAPAKQACYAGPAGSCGVGACRAGVQYCVDGQWGPCLGEVDPQPEVCDGRDQDCNGTVDDGLGTVSCGLGECAVTVPACTNGKPTVCTPKPGVAETCDGKDNDCNGAVDEVVSAGNCSCVFVAPSGNDTTGDGSRANPLKSIGAGIALAQMTGQPKQVCVASGASCPSTTTYSEQVVMKDGIQVYGGYESTNWTLNPSSCVASISYNAAAPSVTFDVNIVHPTILSGFAVRGVGITGSAGAVVANVSGTSYSGYAIVDIKDFNGVPATPLITRSRFFGANANIRSTNSKPVIYGNCSTARDAQGHCQVQTACGSPGGPNQSSFYGIGPGVELDYSPGAVIAENDMCGDTGVLITGNADGTLVRGNSITPYNNGPGTAINTSACNRTSPWIFDNLELSGGTDNYMGNQPGTSYGVVAGGGCNLRIDHNVEIAGLGVYGAQDATGVWCQRDATSLQESRCQIVDNKIVGAKAGVAGNVWGVRCDDLSCPRIEGNAIVGGAGGKASFGVLVNRSGSLIARNTIDSGCSGAGPMNGAVALDATDSFARVENNLITGGACGGQTYGVRAHLIASTDELDLHSNNIFGGGVAAGCTGHAVAFDVGASAPSGPRGLLRNDILEPGPCASNGFDVDELTAMASPRVVENDDFSPALVLYQSAGAGALTLAQINALPNASGNFSADPMLSSDDIHLNAGSMCISSGTSDGAPPDDYFGVPRGATPDVGMQQK